MVSSGVAKLTSDFDCSNFCSFSNMTFFRMFSKFCKELRYKKFHKFEVLISIVRLCYGSPRNCDFFAFKYDCLNPSTFEI